MKKLIKDFKQARLAVIQALDSFPKGKREEILFEKWTLKDLIAHMNGWNIIGTKAVRSLKQGKTAPWAGNIHQFNELNVKLPISGFRSPSRFSGAALFSNSLTSRPLKETQIISS